MPLRPNSRARQQHIDLLVRAGDDLVVQQGAGIRIYRFSAALNILRTIADMLNPGLTTATTSASPGLAIVEAIDPPLKLPKGDAMDWLDVVLPAKAEMHRLISCAIDRALVCHQCIERQTFGSRVDELYDPSKTHIISKNKSFMSLVYAALALGERYSVEDEGSLDLQANAGSLPPG